jgi:hypothetical protein
VAGPSDHLAAFELTWRSGNGKLGRGPAGRAEWTIKPGVLPAEAVFGTGHSGKRGRGPHRRNILRPGHGRGDMGSFKQDALG